MLKVCPCLVSSFIGKMASLHCHSKNKMVGHQSLMWAVMSAKVSSYKCRENSVLVRCIFAEMTPCICMAISYCTLWGPNHPLSSSFWSNTSQWHVPWLSLWWNYSSYCLVILYVVCFDVILQILAAVMSQERLLMPWGLFQVWLDQDFGSQNYHRITILSVLTRDLARDLDEIMTSSRLFKKPGASALAIWNIVCFKLISTAKTKELFFKWKS